MTATVIPFPGPTVRHPAMLAVARRLGRRGLSAADARVLVGVEGWISSLPEPDRSAMFGFTQAQATEPRRSDKRTQEGSAERTQRVRGSLSARTIRSL